MADGTPAGFSSPMGGSGSKRALNGVSAVMGKIATSAKSYADDMERAAKAAERVAHASTQTNSTVKPTSSMIGMGSPVGGGKPVGGGPQFTPPPGLTPTATYAQSTYASGPAGAAQGWAKPLGGAANIPAAPPGNASAPGSPAGTTTNNPAADPATKSKPKTTAAFSFLGGAAMTTMGAVAAAATNPATFSSNDFLSNRAALTMSGGYNKQQAGNILQGFSGGFMSQEQKSQMFMPLVQGSGFAVGSTNFATVAQGAESIGALNPMLASQAGQMSNDLRSPQMFNALRSSMGVSTIGAGGKARAFGDIVHDLERQATGSSKPMTVDEVNAASAPGSRFRTANTAIGMSSDMQQSILDRLRQEAGAGKYLTDTQAGAHGKGNKSTDTIAGDMQQRAGASDKVITAMATQYAEGFRKANDKIDGALTGIADTLSAGNGKLAKALGQSAGAAGATVHGGDTFSKIAGGIATGGLLAKGAGMIKKSKWGGRLVDEEGNVVDKEGKAVTGKLAQKLTARFAARSAAGELSAGAESTAAGLGAGAMGIGAAALLGLDGIWGAAHADTSEGRFSKHAWKSAWEHGLGGQMFGYKAPQHGDGPGRPSVGSASWTGITTGRFNGREFGDGVADAQKARGEQTYTVIEQFMKENYPGGSGAYKVTSDLRHGASGVTVSGNVSYHATGQAADFAGPSPSWDSPQLLAINKFWAQYASGLNELIYAGPGGTLIKDGQVVGPDRYGKKVMKIHHNHVHVAATAAMLKKMKKGKGTSLFGRIVGGIKSAAGSLWNSAKSVLGVGKRSTGKQQSTSATSAVSMLARASRNATAAQAGQGSLIAQLLAGTGDNGDTGIGRGMGPGRVDPGEAGANPSTGGANGTAKASATSAKSVHGMPPGDAMDNAMTIIKVAKQMGLTEWGAVIGVATAEQESNLINLHGGDRDSQGLFQQRPSQGWGTVAEVTNPQHAAQSFFSRLKGTDYQHLPLTVAAQQVQRSGFPDAYAKWQGRAEQIVKESKQYGDGPGRATSQTSDVPEIMHHPMPAGRSSGGGSLSVHGGHSITIGKVEVILTTPQVGQAEAKRIGKMVADQIASEARKKAVMR